MVCIIPDGCKSLYYDTLDRVQAFEIFGRGVDHSKFVRDLLLMVNEMHVLMNTDSVQTVTNRLMFINTILDNRASMYDHLTRADINEFMRIRRQSSDIIDMINEVCKQQSSMKDILLSVYDTINNVESCTKQVGAKRKHVNTKKCNMVSGVQSDVMNCGCVETDTIRHKVKTYVDSLNRCTIKDICHASGLTNGQVVRAIKPLVDTGYVTRSGIGRNVVYTVVK